MSNQRIQNWMETMFIKVKNCVFDFLFMKLYIEIQADVISLQFLYIN